MSSATAQHNPHQPRPSDPARTRAKGQQGWFRAFWRWHFYASFLVIPVLAVLAVTGLIYLLRFQIEPALHADVMTVQPQAGQEQTPYAAQLTAVQKAYPDLSIASATEPTSPDLASRFSGVMPDGSSRDVFVNPWTGQVLGDLNPDTTLSGGAIRLHGDLMAGSVGEFVMELGSCWAIVMAVTGYLIFLKGRKARLRRLAARAKGSALRNRHGWIGAVTGVGLLLLVVTGLPWTGIWGTQVQNWTAEHGSGLWSNDPGAQSSPTSTLDESLPHSHKVDVPWGLGKDEVPTSDPTSVADGQSVANIDTALLVGAREGLRHPMTVAIPEDDGDVFSVIGYAFHDPGHEKTVHVDQFGGQVVSTYGYQDYPKLAQAVSQGIALHEGRRFGLLNFWVSFAFCVGVLVLCVTGPTMWWRRRPAGSGLGAPRGKLPIRSTWWVALLLAALGVFLPVFGASLVLVLLVDQLLLRRIPRLRSTFAVTN
ncbi:membrane protein [Kineosporia sp. NBRC 101677]|uniref:PepSY-associated TM helix domain-containing protein n=1 Tax=Kineosporia sp. NBRC 101677 TaxID=3032197 RepID=UPI0024A42421|nr:PepSY domain-containing protein [Kineosporia sp. NBRC 101677]GLY16704.1 membrane protein [Kineosporia sp. NBRC 101677]